MTYDDEVQQCMIIDEGTAKEILEFAVSHKDADVSALQAALLQRRDSEIDDDWQHRAQQFATKVRGSDKQALFEAVAQFRDPQNIAWFLSQVGGVKTGPMEAALCRIVSHHEKSVERYHGHHPDLDPETTLLPSLAETQSQAQRAALKSGDIPALLAIAKYFKEPDIESIGKYVRLHGTMDEKIAFGEIRDAVYLSILSPSHGRETERVDRRSGGR